MTLRLGDTVRALHPNESWGDGKIVGIDADPKLKTYTVERVDGVVGHFHPDQIEPFAPEVLVEGEPLVERQVPGEPFIRTGVIATADEVAAMKAAATAPYIVIGGVPPTDPKVVVHGYARSHGLPEIRGYYGCDLRTGEFVRS